jgi:isopenicillin N synthase-like dioxygenase
MMFRAFAEMFELPHDTFSRNFSWRSSSSLRLLYYPGGSSGGGGQDGALPSSGISPHTDFELFTLMSQDAPGLQIIPRQNNPQERIPSGDGHPAAGDAAWIDMPVRDGEFVIIVGDMLERYTNGALKATPHRVQLVPWERRSIIRFVAVDGPTVVAPLPQFVRSPPSAAPPAPALASPAQVAVSLQPAADDS